MRQCHVGKDSMQMSLFFLEVSGMNVTRSALKGPLYSVVCKAGPAGCAHAWLAEMMLDVTLNPEGLFPERHWWSPPPRKTQHTSIICFAKFSISSSLTQHSRACNMIYSSLDIVLEHSMCLILHHIGGVVRRWVSKAAFVWYTRSAVLSSSEKLFISL